MSITKRRLEVIEWIEGMQDRLLDDRISQPIARHLLRKLPSDIQLLWINASAPQDGLHQDGPSASSPRSYDKHEAEVLQKLRYTLTSACMARLTDADLEDLYFSQGYERTEIVLGDHDAILADAFTLKDEIEASQDAFPDLAMNFDDITLFGSGVKGALNDAGDLFTAVEDWRRYSKSKAYWSFWREWYQGFLDGKPLDWELQRRVAMIPDEDWEKGPEHIARVIEEIRARFALEQRLAELENEVAVLTERNRHSIGGNNPPEEIAQEEIIQGFLVEPVQEIQTQVQAEIPDKSRVRKAVEKLTALLVVAGKWTGGKLDKAVDECVESIGKRAGDSLFAWVVLNSAAITGIVSLARTWLNIP